MDGNEAAQAERGNCLAVMLAGFGLAVLSVVAFILTGGFFLFFLLLLAALGGFAGVHYLLWGRLLERTSADEREREEELRRRFEEAAELAELDPRRPRHE